VQQIPFNNSTDSAYAGPQVLVATPEEYQKFLDCVKLIHRLDDMRMTGELDNLDKAQERKELLWVYLHAQAFVTVFTSQYCEDEHGNFLGYASMAYPASPTGVTQPGFGELAEAMLDADEPTTVKEPTDAGDISVEEPAVSSEANGAAVGSIVS
jgi:hypothetical protein